MIDGSPQLLCYPAAEPLNIFSNHFDIMMEQRSILFLRPLRDTLRKKMGSISDLTIADIYTEIWQPVFEHCRNLLESLANQSMTLSFVKQYLPEEDLNNDVYNLHTGVSKCLKVKPNHADLRIPLWRIEQYRKLCRYQAGARAFLKLRDILHLKGDFKVVEMLSFQVSYHYTLI